MSTKSPDAAGLFRRHHVEMFRFLRRMTADARLAEDLCQEVFLRVARSWAGYEDSGLGRAWLYRIARNVLANHRRDESRRLQAGGLDEIRGEPANSATAELHLGLDGALSALSPTDREVFLLRELGGLGYEDIAACCELSESAVANRLHRTRRELRTLLNPPVRSRPATETRS